MTKGSGDLDINDAVSLSRALNYKAIKKTVNYAVTYTRGKVQEPILNKSARDLSAISICKAEAKRIIRGTSSVA